MSHQYVDTDENRFKEVNFNTEGNLLEEVSSGEQSSQFMSVKVAS